MEGGKEEEKERVFYSAQTIGWGSFCLIFSMLEIDPKLLYMLGKYSINRSGPPPSIYVRQN